MTLSVYEYIAYLRNELNKITVTGVENAVHVTNLASGLTNIEKLLHDSNFGKKTEEKEMTPSQAS